MGKKRTLNLESDEESMISKEENFELESDEDDISFVSSSSEISMKKTSKKKSPKKAAVPVTKPSPKKSKTTPEKPSKPPQTTSSSAILPTKPSQSIPSNNPIPSLPTISMPGPPSNFEGPPITTDASAKKLLLQYFKQQNRPYNALQLYDNLHKRIPKPTLDRVLTVLCHPGEGLLAKDFGKLKVYFLDQTILSTGFSNQELDSLVEENDDLIQEIQQKQHQCQQYKQELIRLLAEPTDDLLDETIDNLQQSLQQKQILSKQNQQQFVSNPKIIQDLTQLIKEFNKTRQYWFERKYLCQEALDLLSENLNKKKNDLINELDIETDEKCHVSLPLLMKDDVIKASFASLR